MNHKQKRLQQIDQLITALMIGVGLVLLLNLTLLIKVEPAQAASDFTSQGQSTPTFNASLSNRAVEPGTWTPLLKQASSPTILDISNLPPRKELKINTITAPFADMSGQVQNQDSISSTNLAAVVLTDDPQTATADDPAVTNFSPQANLGIVKQVTPGNNSSNVNLTVSPVGNCYATPDNGTTVYQNPTALALRKAIAAAGVNGTVKVAGYCAGVDGGQVLDLNQNITILGAYTTSNWSTAQPGLHVTTLDALQSGRVINVNSAVNVNLENLTLTGGQTTGNGGGISNPSGGTVALSNTIVSSNMALSNGGGIYNTTSSSMVMTNTTVSSNTADNGGGIYNASTATMNISQTVIKNNKANGTKGGGIWNEGLLSLNSSAVSNNSIIARPGQGGGIFNSGTGILTVIATTLANNDTPDQGGGIFNEATLTLLNSTLSTNSSGDLGGALYDLNISAGAVLTHVSIISNTASTGAAGIFTQFGNLQLKNSIVALNTGGSNENCNSPITSLGYNIDSNDDCGLNAIDDQINVNPQVSSLQDNGGPSIGSDAGEALLTHALLPTSPALEGAACVAGLTSDQLGQTRPSPVATLCDIGAYESSQTIVPDLSLSKSVTPTTVVAGESLTYTLTFSNAGGGIAQNVVITDKIPISLSNIAVVSSGVTITDTGTLPAYVWQVQDLGPNQSGIITITGQISSNIPTGQMLTNTASISSSDVEDSNTSNNTASASITVPTFDLAIAKSGIRDDTAGVITYTLVVSNNGSSAAPGAIIVDALPTSIASFTWNCVASNGTTCPNTSGSGNLNETSGYFPAGGQLVYNIIAAVASPMATITNTASVTSTTGSGESNLSNNSALVSLAPETVKTRDIYLPILFKNLVSGLD